jgi:hypothetical protein
MKLPHMRNCRENRWFNGQIVILGLCLGCIALCVLGDPVIFAENHGYRVPGDFRDHSHIDEHEEDFVLTISASNNSQSEKTLAKIATHLPDSSQFPSPQTPPPKQS